MLVWLLDWGWDESGGLVSLCGVGVLVISFGYDVCVKDGML